MLDKLRKTSPFSLTAAYILALGIIALASIQSHVFTVHIIKKQAEAARLSFLMSSLRSEAQQILFHAENYYNHNKIVDHDKLEQSISSFNNSYQALHKNIDQDLLEISIASFKSSYQDLHDTIIQKKVLGERAYPELYDSFFLTIKPANERIQKFIQKIKEFTETDIYAPEKREELLKYVQTEARGSLVTILDNILLNYQLKQLEETERYAAWKYWNLIVILTVLVLEALFIFRPLVTQTKRHQDILRRQAYEDVLTGLNNRRAFMRRATKIIRHHRRENKTMSVVVCDLDHFKQINDTYGHKTGDAVLCHFAELLENSVRPGDLTGRLGGEEFAVVISDASLPKAKKIIERLRATIEKTPCEVSEKQEGVSINYTASFGIVAVKGMVWSIEDMLNMADKNLYKAKQNGRNTFVATRVISETDPETGMVPAS